MRVSAASQGLGTFPGIPTHRPIILVERLGIGFGLDTIPLIRHPMAIAGWITGFGGTSEIILITQTPPLIRFTPPVMGGK